MCHPNHAEPIRVFKINRTIKPLLTKCGGIVYIVLNIFNQPLLRKNGSVTRVFIYDTICIFIAMIKQ